MSAGHRGEREVEHAPRALGEALVDHDLQALADDQHHRPPTARSPRRRPRFAPGTEGAAGKAGAAGPGSYPPRFTLGRADRARRSRRRRGPARPASGSRARGARRASLFAPMSSAAVAAQHAALQHDRLVRGVVVRRRAYSPVSSMNLVTPARCPAASDCITATRSTLLTLPSTMRNLPWARGFAKRSRRGSVPRWRS